MMIGVLNGISDRSMAERCVEVACEVEGVKSGLTSVNLPGAAQDLFEEIAVDKLIAEKFDDAVTLCRTSLMPRLTVVQRI